MFHSDWWYTEWHLATKITRFYLLGEILICYFSTRYTTLYYSHGEHVLAFFYGSFSYELFIRKRVLWGSGT